MKAVLLLMAVYAVAVAVKTLWGRKLRRIRILRDLDLSMRGFVSALGVALLISALITGGSLGEELLSAASGLEEGTATVAAQQETEPEPEAVALTPVENTAVSATAEALTIADPDTAGSNAPAAEQKFDDASAVQAEDTAVAMSETALDAVPAPASPYADGTYTGTGYGFKAPITVAVKISSGIIQGVTVTEQRDDRKWFERAYTGVVQQILSAQSAEVDTVSGATFSSQGIIDGASEALDAARAAAKQVSQ